ncbi:hypothetical protein ACJMK2_023039 [Sinanodonta woodiana]|uniref:Uncharacterized protein n=1 Tax=Sinanodonta woodiana TaxID=1069815 RepID=A0ABD3T3T2_SINWO
MASANEKCISSKMRDRLYFRIRTRLGNLAASIRGCLAVIRDRLLLILGMDPRFVNPEQYGGDFSLNLFGTSNGQSNKHCDLSNELSIEKRIQCMLRCCFRGCDVDDDEENSYVCNIPSNKSPRLKSSLRREKTGDTLSVITFSGDESTPSTPTPNRRRRARNTKRSPASCRLLELGLSPTASDHQQADSCGSDEQNLQNKIEECCTDGISAFESHATKQARLLYHRFGLDSKIQKEEENGNISSPILARAHHTPDAIEKGCQSLSSGEGDCKSKRAHDLCVFSNIHGATRANLDNFRFEESFAEPELIIRDEQSFIRICPGVGKLSFAQMLEILNRLLQDYADACVKVSFPNSDTEICVSSEYDVEYPCVQESPQPKEQVTSDKCTITELKHEENKEAESPTSTQDSKSSKNNSKNGRVNVSDNQSSIKRTQPTALNNLVNTHSETLQMKTPEKNRTTADTKITSDSEKNTAPLCMPANDSNLPTPKDISPTKQSNKATHMENTTAKDKSGTKQITQNTQSGRKESARNMNSANFDLNSSSKKQTGSTESDPNALKGTLVSRETNVNDVNANNLDNNSSQTKCLKSRKQCNKGTPRTCCEEGAEKLKVSGAVNEREKKADGHKYDASSTPLTPKKENRSDKCENKAPKTPPYNHSSSVKLQLLQKKICELERVEEREKQLQHVEKLRNESMSAIHFQHKRTNDMTTSKNKQTAHLFDLDSSEDEDSCLSTSRIDAQERVRKNIEYVCNSSDDSDNEVECNFKGIAKSPAGDLSALSDKSAASDLSILPDKSAAGDLSVLPDYEYYEDLNMSVEAEKLTEERAGKLGDRDDANGLSQSPGKWKNSPDENSKHSEPWRRRNAPLYQNDGAFELASHYRIDGRVEAEMSKRGSREKMLPHKEKKKRRGIPNMHLRKADTSNVDFDEEPFREFENVKDDASVCIKEEVERNREKSTERKTDKAKERKPIELVEDTRHFEQIPMEVIMRKAKDDEDIDNKYAVRGRLNDSWSRDKKKKRQRTQSQKPILVCGLPTPHKKKH